MAQLDDAIRTELHATFGDEPGPEQIWSDVAERMTRRGRRRTIRRRTIVGVSVAAVLLAAGLIITVPAHNGGQHPRTHAPQVVDPKAGPGGFSVSPRRALANNQSVRVSVHGLHPDRLVWITMCVGQPTNVQAGTNQCNAPAKMVTLDDNGAAVASFTVSRFLSPGGFQVDCAIYQSGCSIALVEVDSLDAPDLIANTEPVTFVDAPPAPSNPLQISAAPNEPYASGQTVTVSGKGFPSSMPIRVGECPTDTDCGDYFQTVESTPQGTFSAVVVLHATYTVEQGNSSGGESPVQIDCHQSLRCFLMAEEDTAPYGAASSIPLTFAAAPTDNG